MIRFSRDRVRDIGALLRAARTEAAADRRPDRREGTVPAGMAGLTVATWNIHSSVGLDARFSPQRIAEVIRALDVDLIGLQEVGWHHRGEAGLDQFAYLAEATGLAVHAAPTKHSERAHYGNAVLTRLPVLSMQPLDLSLPRREPRGALAITVEIAGRPVRAVVAHLGLDPWERTAQIARITALVEEQPELPTLFMGDLNEWTRNSPRLRHLAACFDDCASPRSFHAQMPTLRLDRIYVRGGLRLVGFEVCRTLLTQRASDHLPVRAVVAVP